MKQRDSGWKTGFAATSAKFVSWAVRSLGLGEGATLPGRVLLALRPQAIGELSRDLPVVLISGTNAKTTTTALASEALSGSFEVVTNVTGANMDGGVAFALAAAARTRGAHALGVFEVDEGYLSSLGSILETRVVALLNLSRDQLDRVSETRMTAAKWKNFIEANSLIKVVANCDDPLIVYSAQGGSDVLWVAAGLNFKLDARSCPACGGEIEFAASGWQCSCGFTRPIPDVKVDRDTVVVKGRPLELDLSLPGRCNVANAAVVIGISEMMGVDLTSAARRMSYVSEVGGRYKRVEVDGHEVRLLLSKNPAGWLEVFDMVGEDPSVVVAVNSQVADGRDPSWLWDVPFEALKGKEVFAAGERALDLSVRLHYAGVPHRVVKDSMDAVRLCAGKNVSFVGNYTSFQDFRKRVLSKNGSIVEGIREFGDRVLR